MDLMLLLGGCMLVFLGLCGVVVVIASALLPGARESDE